MSPWPVLAAALVLAAAANACHNAHRRWRRAARTPGAAMTRRLTHALAALYTLTALALAPMAVTSWRHDAWPHALLLAGTSLLLITAVVHHSWQRDELRYALARLERASRPEPAIDGAVAVALAGACCEPWWTSAGTEHDQQCTRKDQTA